MATADRMPLASPEAVPSRVSKLSSPMARFVPLAGITYDLRGINADCKLPEESHLDPGRAAARAAATSSTSSSASLCGSSPCCASLHSRLQHVEPLVDILCMCLVCMYCNDKTAERLACVLESAAGSSPLAGHLAVWPLLPQRGVELPQGVRLRVQR